MIVGHTHRVSNLMVGKILVTEGINAGASYSVLQLMVKSGDVAWAGGATRVAKTIGVTPRADVQAIVDQANADTAVLRNQVIGTQANDILRDPDPAPRVGDGQHGRRRDAGQVSRASTPRTPTPAVCARTSSCAPPSAGEARRRDHLGRDVRRAAVRQPDRHRDADRRPADDRRSSTGSRRSATRVRGWHRSVPAVSGLKVTFHCTGTTPVVDGIWKTPSGIVGPATPVGPTDTVRFVTNDFMFTGGDGYTVFTQGTDVLQPGDALLDVAIEYVTAHPPSTRSSRDGSSVRDPRRPDQAT